MVVQSFLSKSFNSHNYQINLKTIDFEMHFQYTIFNNL